MSLKARLGPPARVVLPIAPLIAVGLQLLVFFVLTQRMTGRESGPEDFLPIGTTPLRATDDSNLSPIRVTLRSDAAGNLTQLAVGALNLGNDDAAFERLSREVLKLVQPGSPLTRDVEVEIDADYEVQYQHILRAVSHCTGRIDPQTGELVRYVEKIKFAPPHRPRREL